MTSTTKATLAFIGALGTVLTTAFSYGAITGVTANENALLQVKTELSQRVSTANEAHARYDSSLVHHDRDIRELQDERIATKKDLEYIKAGIDELKRINNRR